MPAHVVWRAPSLAVCCPKIVAAVGLCGHQITVHSTCSRNIMQGGRQSGSRQKNRKPGNGWYHVADVADFEGGKQKKTVIMGGNKQVKAYSG